MDSPIIIDFDSIFLSDRLKKKKKFEGNSFPNADNSTNERLYFK